MIFLPTGYSIIFFGFAGLALILPLFRKSDILAGQVAERFHSSFFESHHKYFNRIIFVAAISALFAVFAAPTHFLGDGYTVLDNIASDTGTLFKWSEVGIIFLLKTIRTVLGRPYAESARTAFQIISILSGAVSIWLFFVIVHQASENKIKKLLIFTAVFFSGVLLLFFGYVENYPIIWVFLCLFIYAGLKYDRCGKGLVLLWLALIFGTIVHLQMAVLLPAAVYLTISGTGEHDIFRHFRGIIWIVLGIVLAALASILVYKYFSDLYIQAIFLKLFPDRFAGGEYTILSFSHLIDIFNELILLSPLLFVLILNLRKGRSESTPARTIFFLSAAASGHIIFLLIVDPKLGLARDWDLFSTTAFALTILLLVFIDENRLESIRKYVISMILILALWPMPFLFTNLSHDSSIQYSEYLISLDMEKSYSPLSILRNYYRDHGFTQKADSLSAIYFTGYPGRNKCDSAVVAMERGDIKSAVSILERVEPDRYDEYYQRTRGRLHFFQGNYDSALFYINNAIQLKKYSASNYGHRADIYIARRLYDKALIDLRQGYRLNNSNLYVLDLLVNTFSGLGIYDSSIFYADKRIALDATFWPTYYELAKAYAMMNDPDKAQFYADKMAEFRESHPGYISRLQEVTELIKELRAKN